MQSLHLVLVFLTAAATAAVVTNELPDLVNMPKVEEAADVADGDEVADADVKETSGVVVTDVAELIDDAGEAESTEVATRSNLNLGTIGLFDVLVYNAEVWANGVANHFHVRDITIRTNRVVSAIRVNRVGSSQNATPSILSGGIGSSFVTIRIRSATGRGYNYRIQVYVR